MIFLCTIQNPALTVSRRRSRETYGFQLEVIKRTEGCSYKNSLSKTRDSGDSSGDVEGGIGGEKTFILMEWSLCSTLVTSYSRESAVTSSTNDVGPGMAFPPRFAVCCAVQVPLRGSIIG
jgi:hypothetical protein